MKLVDLLAADLDSSNSEREIYALAAIYWIADIHMCGGDAATLLDDEPYKEQIIATEFSGEFIDEVKSILRSYIANQKWERISSAIGILGTFADPTDKELFDHWLEVALTNLLQMNGMLHQSLIALQSLSEVDIGTHSLTDIERSVELSRGYLSKYGREITA